MTATAAGSAITIRKLPEGAKQKLRMRAAAHGRSMEAEARDILVSALDTPVRADLSWVDQLIQLGYELGGVELPIPEDEPIDFDELEAMFSDRP